MNKEELQAASGDVLFVIQDRFQAGGGLRRWGVTGNRRSVQAVPARLLMLGSISCCDSFPASEVCGAAAWPCYAAGV